MPINKFTTLLDLSRQAKIITGETATFDGKILAGIPFSGYPTGVNTATTVSLGVVSTENAAFSGNTGTTVFDVSNPLSPYYNPLFSGYTATTWTNPLFSATTSGLTLPITILSADTQVVGPFWTLTQTGYTGDYIIGTEYTGYSVTYSFINVSQFNPNVFSGVTSASQENFSAGTLDYKGPLDYLSSKENISVDGRLITNKITITNGASSATTNYVLSQIDDTGKGGWNSLSSLLSGSCLPIVNLETINDCSSGITFNSDVTINGDVIVNGSATTINTEIIRSKDNNIILNYSGNHLTSIGGGLTLEDGVSNGVDSRIYSDSNGVWLFDPSLSASSGTINSLSADTIGSSGDCVNDLYVSNIHSCSPLNINPLDEGNVYFGSTSGVTIDVTNSRLGIGTINPSEKLHISSGDMLVENTNGKYYTDIQNTTGPLTILSGNSSGVSRFGVIVPTYDSVTLGVRGPSAGFPGYGKQGDAFIYSSGPNNGFNLISAPGTGTDDYIRFYAGSIATSTPSMHIQGSGTTKGYVGINTSNPQYLLDVVNTNSRLFYDPTSVGGRLSISGKTNVPRFGVEIPAYLTKPQASTSLGIRAWDDLLYPDYGNPGDVHLYAGVNAYGLNIISEYGATSADYIRFYAGQDASSGNTPDIHIQGSGVTRGYVGIGTSNPQYKLDVVNTNSRLFYESTFGGSLSISGATNLPRLGTFIPPYLTKPGAGGSVGMRSWDDATFPAYGEVGDMFIYSDIRSNGLNLISAPGAGTDDYIRFYAGKTAISTNTPAIHIQGSGTTKGYVGINTSNPQYLLDVVNTNSRLYYDPTSVGGSLSISGATNLPRFTLIVPPYLTKPLALGSMGIRAWNDTLYSGYGKVGDMHIYASNSANGLNIINQGPGTNTEDYIRFYAGRDALFNPDIHIQGSGVTRGYVGIGTSSPSEKLDVNGKTKTTTLQVTSGSINGYVLVSDSVGNATWQSASGATSGVTFWTASTGVDAIVVKNSGSVASGLLSLGQGIQTIASGDYSHAEGYYNIASGIASHAEGGAYFGKLGIQSFPTSATSYSSHAEGVGTLASGQGSHAEGWLGNSSGAWSHSEGQNTISLGQYSHSEGNGSLAGGSSSHAEGIITNSNGDGSHAEGIGSASLGFYSHAEGAGTISSGSSSHAEGALTISLGDYSHAEGSGTTASGTWSHAEGEETLASGQASHAEGYFNIASGVASHAEGGAYFGKSGLQDIPTSATTYSSHAEGIGTLSSGQGSHAEGQQTSATTFFSHSEGRFTLASGESSHSEGNSTLASGVDSHAEGYFTSATTDSSHAEGYFTLASNQFAHSEGGTTIASGKYSHSEGSGTTASGFYSHAEGVANVSSGIGSHSEGAVTTASGNYSHAEGFLTTASTLSSHSEGIQTLSSGTYSHAEGFSTNSIGSYSHAEGGRLIGGSQTTSIGLGSHAEGFSTTATTSGSHSEGWGTIAYEPYQHVSGRWNTTGNTNQYFIIGRGTNNASRSNAFRVDSAGNVYGAGATYNSGADYAEYFESLSGDSIPYGTVVELLDDKIKVCVDANNAMGVISSNPTLIGNNEGGTADEWVGKYETDEWGRYIMEDYSYDVIDYMTESGETIYKTITEQIPKLSQDFNPNMIYIPRSERPEWNVVGLVGQVRVLKNQQIPSRWIKMKDINNDIALYLIR